MVAFGDNIKNGRVSIGVLHRFAKPLGVYSPREFESLSYRMKYLTDRKRHLICLPYSVDNLHKMAEDLGINRCWFHKDHYDIPKMRIKEIEDKCEIVSSKEICKIARNL